MNICIIGDNLTSLTLAKNLVNKKINISIFCRKRKFLKKESRTIGISKHNLEFFNKEIIKLKNNIIWSIHSIEIFNESNKKEKILNFQQPDKKLFSMVKNDEIYKSLENNLKKNIYCKKIFVKNENSYKKILKNNNYALIINCENNNIINRKYFYKKIVKKYDSFAYTLILDHKRTQNRKAIQIFTNKGPIAFLPISETKTSVVFSKVNEKTALDESKIKNLIKYYNCNYEIKSFSKLEKFPLTFSIPRNYYNKNLMLFGDNLHKIHPLAGQGFNMTLRDIEVLSKIISSRIDLGLPLDISIYNDFENEIKHFNSIFSYGIDFIYEFFKFDNKYNNLYSNKIFKILTKNALFNNLSLKFADKGLFI